MTMITSGRLAVVLLLLTAGVCRSAGQTLTTLWQFNGTNGNYPNGLVQGADGSFYGTTASGGTNNDGTVFKFTSGGTLTMLWQFNGTNGLNPDACLFQGNDGNFYGTTEVGGTNDYGTVFKITPQGRLTTLWQFNGTNGEYPVAGLVQGSDGYFYGTTAWGGTNGVGTVFSITSQGTLTTLWQFNGGNGEYPDGGLVQGGDGNFYSTTSHGGTNDSGTVFKITPQRNLTTLWQFGPYPSANSLYPWAGLVQGNDGSFYGTTEFGGDTNLDSYGYGTVFRITPQGTLTTLWQFNLNNGEYPLAGLVQGSDGNFYGTTINGGSNNVGTVFNITPQGTLTTLYQFGGIPTDGNYPVAGLVQGSDGNFYGTTSGGGTNGAGTFFQLSLPLNPPANQISSAQVDSSGTNLVFSIPSVACETYQLQFSASMNPTNWVNVPAVSITNSIGALLTLTNFGGATGSQRFYRFAITP